MALQCGIVGLPNVGKSTLFNCLSNAKAQAANFPFCTIEPNVGVITVPDERLAVLEKLVNPERVVPTTVEIVDIAGLVKGASKGEGLGNKFLSHIREVDAICEVVRCFEDENITHVEGNVDPIRDIEIINIELMLADLEVVDNRLNRIGKKATMSKDKETLKEVELLNRIKESLEQNIPVRKLEFDETELKILKPFNLLTGKPIIYIANVKEEDLIDDDNEYVKLVREYANNEGSEVIKLCAKIESELSELNDDEKNAFLKDLGITESGLDKLIQATYSILGLATFFTVGEDEVRAWTFRKGMKAPACAGIIHSDFERGFIRAEIMSYDTLVECGSEKAVRDAGKMQLEGKDYIMRDGDICHFRFNV